VFFDILKRGFGGKNPGAGIRKDSGGAGGVCPQILRMGADRIKTDKIDVRRRHCGLMVKLSQTGSNQFGAEVWSWKSSVSPGVMVAGHVPAGHRPALRQSR
jgi:hypothetical protein